MGHRFIEPGLLNRMFEINASSRKSMEKRRISELLELVGPDDRIVVSELSRLSRSIGQTIMLIDAIQKTGAKFHCLKNSLVIATRE